METYLCIRGDPWSPMDLDRALAAAAQEVPREATGVMIVDHWDLADMPLAVARGDADALSVVSTGDFVVAVFHDAVDPVTRVCEHCGKVCGKTIGRLKAKV